MWPSNCLNQCVCCSVVFRTCAHMTWELCLLPSTERTSSSIFFLGGQFHFPLPNPLLLCYDSGLKHQWPQKRKWHQHSRTGYSTHHQCCHHQLQVNTTTPGQYYRSILQVNTTTSKSYSYQFQHKHAKDDVMLVKSLKKWGHDNPLLLGTEWSGQWTSLLPIPPTQWLTMGLRSMQVRAIRGNQL